MDSMLSALAFALLIGGQFLATIVATSKKEAIYADPREPIDHPLPLISDHANENAVEVRLPAKAA